MRCIMCHINVRSKRMLRKETVTKARNGNWWYLPMPVPFLRTQAWHRSAIEFTDISSVPFVSLIAFFVVPQRGISDRKICCTKLRRRKQEYILLEYLQLATGSVASQNPRSDRGQRSFLGGAATDRVMACTCAYYSTLGPFFPLFV